MKNLKCSLVAKITAVLLSYIMALVLTLSVVAVAFMGYGEFYTNSAQKLEHDILRDMAYKDCHLLAGYDKFERENLSDYYKDKNIYFTIEDSKMTEQVLALFFEAASMGELNEYTTGHYKRGVE